MKISTSSTPANISKVMGLLAVTPKKLSALSKSVPKGKRNQPLGKGERSLTETLAHLVNSEARISESIYLALLLDEPLIPDIHSERDWGKLLRHNLADFAELLAYFKFRRAAMMRVLSGLSENQWGRSIREAGKRRKESIYWRARSLALHESEHIKDLENKIGMKS